MAFYYYTPLRYPGGKSRLSNYFKKIFEINSLCDGHYVEPYAGGAGIALALIMTEYAQAIHLNDLNRSLIAFWYCILYQTEELCRRIHDCKLSVAQWKYNKNILRDEANHSNIELGFAFLYLNRTNRSGIINGGLIGGLEQKGKWKLDARFNKSELIKRIQRVAEYKCRIHIYNMDASQFIESIIPTLPTTTLVYLDPPYYNKGQRLYDNYYSHDDHKHIADLIQKRIQQKWLVSYDNVLEICQLYSNRRRSFYTLKYSAANYYEGSEVMFYDDSLILPVPNDPRIDLCEYF